MLKTIRKYAGALGFGLLVLLAGHTLTIGNALAGETKKHSHDHSHNHDKTVYKGYFEDSQVAPRNLSDWEGKWQSVYPFLLDGTLDPVMEHKASHGDKTAKEYRDYYEIGYKTDVNHIDIDGDKVSFHKEGSTVSGRYASDGHEILTYAKGNRGVRFIFKKVEGDSSAPQFIQFSDHRISPEKADHYHLYWGDDREALLKQLTNWPTYYDASLDGKAILDEMLKH